MPADSVSAVKLCPFKAADEAKEKNLQMPTATLAGLHPTLTGSDGTKYGTMSDNIDQELFEFVQIASRANANVLEVGAAYGTGYLLEAFNCNTTAGYTALDVVGDQLRILARRIEESFPAKFKSNLLTLIEGPFPKKQVVAELNEGGYDAILASRVLQFLTEEEVVEAFRQVHRLLKPGGKFFAKMPTPYNGIFNPKLMMEISSEIKKFVEQNDQKKRPLPGFVERRDHREFRNPSLDKETIAKLGMTETHLHLFLFDREVTDMALKSAGFSIEMCDYKPMTSPPWKYDGREYLLVIAKKL